MNRQLNSGLVTTPGIPSDTTTVLVREELAVRFSFWMEGQVQDGIRLQGELFRYVARFDAKQRAQAFDLAGRLTQAEKQTVVTVKGSCYTVWESLRSPQVAPPSTSNN